ncbi:Fic family protein [Amycolatopsis sp. WQ 127309]|uniref:Fic family protein n=1 Tax=Amycolatopsis sp. WQ 127309 TaxID=2932773 RepID=UPI001FF110B4|nr:Fic/DOC family N-terminal domain-containing protein [Amycolatopsis sp. WQ 127309]UOZ09382.1 Fic family protein [Amycolatopsis sp. WQ 127309]
MQVEDFKDSPVGRLTPISGTDSRTRRTFDHFAFVPDALPSEIPLGQATYNVLSKADRAIGGLNARLSQLPNPSLLVRPALTQEAMSTSALEGTYAPLADVLEAQYGNTDHLSSEVREIRNYVSAADRGLELIRTHPICLRVVAELQRVLVDRTRGDSYDAGQLRDRLVCIGDRGRGIEQSRFVPPPHGDALIEGVSDWEKWINRVDDIPILVKAAMGHYQFETLHPFSDGNGRIGRLTITLQLIAAGVLDYPVLNLSPWLEPRRDDYIDHLLRISKTGQYDGWVSFFAEAVTVRSEAAIQTIEDLMSFREEVLFDLREKKFTGVVTQLGGDLIGYPIVSVNDVKEIYNVAYPTANNAVAKLCEAGYLKELTGRSYGRLFVCDRVYDVINNGNE